MLKSLAQKPWTNIDRMFVRDAKGTIVKSKGLWSSYSDECIDCKRSDRLHEAKGRCRACHHKWRRANDPEFRARKNRLQKESTLRNWQEVEKRDKLRGKTKKRKAQRKEISARYYNKITKWPIGGTVYYLFADQWITGTILTKTNASAVVQFKTFSKSIPFRKMRQEKPFLVLDEDVA